MLALNFMELLNNDIIKWVRDSFASNVINLYEVCTFYLLLFEGKPYYRSVRDGAVWILFSVELNE